MASSDQPLSADKVRSSHREQVSGTSAPNAYEKPTIENAIPGDPDGLMHIDKIEGDTAEPIQVRVKKFADLPEEATDVTHVYLEWKLASWDDFQFLEHREIRDPVTQPVFPGDFNIEKSKYDGHEGTFEVRYRVKEWQSGDEFPSNIAKLTLDRTGPLDPDAPLAAIVPKLITTALLDAEGGVECEIPDPKETKPVVVGLVFLDHVPEQLPPPEELHFFNQLPNDRKIKLDKKIFEDFGSRTLYCVYGLIDKAGNPSHMSWPVTVKTALGKLPSGLKPPTVPLADDADLIDRKDAANPTTVHTGTIDNYEPEDRIRIIWGKESFIGGPMFQLGPTPQVVVPWKNMNAAYDYDAGGVQNTPLKFEVLRGDHPIESPPRPNPLKVDLEVPIENPGGPDPEHPDFIAPVITSSTGSVTDLKPVDAGEPATVTCTLPDGLINDDVVTAWWNGLAVEATAHPIDGTEGDTIDIEVPWEVIEKTPMMLNLPVYFQVKRPGVTNPLNSPKKTINVKVLKIELPQPEVKMKGTMVNCNDLLEENSKWGIHVLNPPGTARREHPLAR